jgi:hypothetical protein
MAMEASLAAATSPFAHTKGYKIVTRLGIEPRTYGLKGRDNVLVHACGRLIKGIFARGRSRVIVAAVTVLLLFRFRLDSVRWPPPVAERKTGLAD